MLRFPLFGFPITIHWMFWVLCLMLGIGYLDGEGPEALMKFGLLTLVLFLSIVLHELGHAFARRKFGASHSEITLYGLGGYCAGPGRFTKWQSIGISAAGPAANVILVGVGLLLGLSPGMENPMVRSFVFDLIMVNGFLFVFNVLPIYPLDGGQIFGYLMGPSRLRVVFWTGIIIAGTIAVFGLLSRSIFTAIICGMLAYENWQRLQGRPSGIPGN
ncbi:MAG: hypothetical protein CMO55_14290 [Verrucomicrobiales bacterium]|nr:hypothetical protein [Verrucomicrobiales bacterium]